MRVNQQGMPTLPVETIIVEAVTALPTAAAVLSLTENKPREVPLFVPSLEGIQKKKYRGQDKSDAQVGIVYKQHPKGLLTGEVVYQYGPLTVRYRVTGRAHRPVTYLTVVRFTGLSADYARRASIAKKGSRWV